MRCAIVTGAGSGIGRATAERLAARGFAVAVVGRTRESLEKAAEDLRAAGAKAESAPCDVSRPEQVEAMVHRVMAAFGRIDVLVNNAGVAPGVPLAKMSVEQWREVLDTNLSAAFYATRAVWPVMERQEPVAGTRGVIVNISSMASRDPFPGLGAYAAAKAGVNMLTLMTGREGAPLGIRAVCIAPAAVDTPMLRKLLGEKMLPESMMLKPVDVAEAVAAAVEGALKFSSGETIFVHSGSA